MIGREIIRLASVPSTMDLIDDYARAGAREGLVLVADHQTAGRGRSGRTWISAPGDGLLCSVLLRPSVAPDRLGPLPLLLGTAVAETVETFVSELCQVKWPNDALIGGRKVAGILVQSRVGPEGIDFVNVGIGINIRNVPETMENSATSIAAEGGMREDRDAVLRALLINLDLPYRTWIESGGTSSLNPWRQRAAMLGEHVTVRQNGDSICGRFHDVDDDGRLLLELDSGERIALASGDLDRGPRASTLRTRAP